MKAVLQYITPVILVKTEAKHHFLLETEIEFKIIEPGDCWFDPL
jgi:hypothetical protein